jgi:hypothetical protein
MGFLRRLLGGDPPKSDSVPPADPAEGDAAEAAYERELLREDQERLSELTRRQLRYADYAWNPPAQGGERRADDPDEERPSDSTEPG